MSTVVNKDISNNLLSTGAFGFLTGKIFLRILTKKRKRFVLPFKLCIIQQIIQGTSDYPVPVLF